MSRYLCSLFMLTIVSDVVTGDNLALLSAASSGFSHKLYQQVALNKDSLVYSPLSIHLSLTLSLYGARGTTETQMAEALGLTLHNAATHQAYRDVIVKMNSVTSVELLTSNALFLNPKFPIEPDFVKKAKENYFSLATNFQLNPEKTINDYVSDKTRGKITNLLPPGTIDSNTALVLINTLFFNGTWDIQFRKDRTKKQDFYKQKGVKSEVDMMRDTRQVYLKKDDKHGVDILQLPFKNKRFGLYIVLPREMDKIGKLESLLQSPSNVDEFFSPVELTRVAISVPKFKIETSLPLNDPLQKLGMKDAFNPSLADFKGISPVGVFISKVLHKSIIEVQETGTVAAAATAVVVQGRSFQRAQDTFTADHQFLFFLRDNETKHILFQGKFCG